MASDGREAAIGHQLLVVLSIAACLAGALMADEPPAPPARPPNVILVLIDGLRADHTSCLGYQRPTTPNLDALARRSTLFEQAVSQSTHEMAASAALRTSQYPFSHRADRKHPYLDRSLPTLGTLLSKVGYRTAAFTGGGPLSRCFGTASGMETFSDQPEFGSFAHTVPAALAWLSADSAKPSYLILQGYDIRAPYDPPLGLAEMYDPGYKGRVHDQDMLGPAALRRIWNGIYFPTLPDDADAVVSIAMHKLDMSMAATAASTMEDDRDKTLPPSSEGSRLSPADLSHIVAHYDAAATYADTWLGYFLERVQTASPNGLVLIVTSSFGMELGEHGMQLHGHHLYDVETHVPLLLAAPGMALGRRVADVVELVDIPPTVLELVNAPSSTSHQGRSLAPLLSMSAGTLVEKPGISQLGDTMAARTRRFHMLLPERGSPVLYDLERDPLETQDVAHEFPQARDELRKFLNERFDQLWRPSGVDGLVVTDENRIRIPGLGY